MRHMNVSKSLLLLSVASVLAGGNPVIAEQVALAVSVSTDSSDPSSSEVSVEVHNLGADEIWNVDVRLESGHIGICPSVFQVGRISAGATGRTSELCVGTSNASASDELLWRLDFDSDAGHGQLVVLGADESPTEGGL